MTDLGNINLEEGAEKGSFLQLEHPVTGEKLATEDGDKIGFELAGTDSKRYRNKISELANRKMRKRQKTVTLEQTEREACEILAACTIAPHNVVINGEVLEADEEQIAQAYYKHRWIREQVDEFVGDRRNFFLIA